MKAFFIINSVLLFLIASGYQQAFPQFEKNNEIKREVFDAKKYPGLRAVGRLRLIGQKQCTVILVASDVAVTAAHCFLESKIRFDLTRELNPGYTAVIFRTKGRNWIKDVNVKKVLKIREDTDYAIVKLDKKIPDRMIKPLKISNLTFQEMRAREKSLGCAGFNGDKELGDDGNLMTISRNIKIISESNKKKRVDTTCFSFDGGSGGLLFEERFDPATKSNDHFFVGVIWGLTHVKTKEKGIFFKDKKVITSITPVSVFYDELLEIINKN